jgi:hypothetical protein
MDATYKWNSHINLFTCAQNACKSSLQVWTPWGSFTDQKEYFKEFLGRHRTQEVAAGFLGKMIVSGISVMCLRGVAVVPRCLMGVLDTFWGGVTRRFGVDCE